MVLRLVDDYIQENVAKAGVQQAKENLIYDEIIVWCLEHEYEDEDVRIFCEEYNKDAGNQLLLVKMFWGRYLLFVNDLNMTLL